MNNFSNAFFINFWKKDIFCKINEMGMPCFIPISYPNMSICYNGYFNRVSSLLTMFMLLLYYYIANSKCLQTFFALCSGHCFVLASFHKEYLCDTSSSWIEYDQKDNMVQDHRQSYDFAPLHTEAYSLEKPLLIEWHEPRGERQTFDDNSVGNNQTTFPEDFRETCALPYE